MRSSQVDLAQITELRFVQKLSCWLAQTPEFSLNGATNGTSFLVMFTNNIPTFLPTVN